MPHLAGMRKWQKRILVSIAVCSALAFIAAWIILPGMVVYRPRMNAQTYPQLFNSFRTPEELNLKHREFDYIASDSVTIDAELILAAENNEVRGTIVMLHGIGGCKESFYSAASQYAKMGFNTVLIDLRGHGASGGKYCTFGYAEKNDVAGIVRKLKQIFPEKPVGIYGCSLGGAIALQSMAQEGAIDFGIIACTFDDVKNVVREYTAHYLGFKCNWIADFALWRAESLASFEASEIKPYESARKINKPMLIIHGSDDINIPIALGKRNFDSLASAHKEFYEVKGGNHGNLERAGGAEYKRRMADFLDYCTSEFYAAH
jgi:uncharacterized protein